MMKLCKLKTKPPTLIEIRKPRVPCSCCYKSALGKKIILDHHSTMVFSPPCHILQGLLELISLGYVFLPG